MRSPLHLSGTIGGTVEPKERIWAAIDTADIGIVLCRAKAIGSSVGGIKFGFEAVTKFGLDRLINTVRGYGPATETIVADLKLHDIPETMARAMKAVAGCPAVKYVTVHALAGEEGLRAVNAVKGHVKTLAVTVLTSHDAASLAKIFGPDAHAQGSRDTLSLSLKLTHLAREAGCDGIICSPREVATLRRSTCFPDFVFATPGIRPLWAAAGDQKRIAPPGRAVKDGADFVIVGRPLFDAANGQSSFAAALAIAEEIAEATR